MNYRFVQDPGTFNALGIVRINMPNKHSVYMHDTPLKQLFNQSARAFSSGCVRVERVLDVVAWLLGPQRWSLEKVQEAAADGRRENVKLTSPVPVHFVYLTAFVAENGVAQFRPDIYGRDAPAPTTPMTRMPSSPSSAAPLPPRDADQVSPDLYRFGGGPKARATSERKDSARRCRPREGDGTQQRRIGLWIGVTAASSRWRGGGSGRPGSA